MAFTIDSATWFTNEVSNAEIAIVPDSIEMEISQRSLCAVNVITPVVFFWRSLPAPYATHVATGFTVEVGIFTPDA